MAEEPGRGEGRNGDGGGYSVTQWEVRALEATWSVTDFLWREPPVNFLEQGWLTFSVK